MSALAQYQIASPRQTHFGRVTCEQAECAAFLNGWQTVIDETAEQGMGQANYIRRHSGRGFTESHNEAGHTVFIFHAGQTCFAASEHYGRVDDRPPLYLVHDGDRQYRHTTADSWADDLATHQNKLIAEISKG